MKIEPERLKMFNLGASEAPAFVAAAEEMTRIARDLGPNPIKKSPPLLGKKEL